MNMKLNDQNTIVDLFIHRVRISFKNEKSEIYIFFLLESISFIYSHKYFHIHILISNFRGSLLILLTVGKD